MTYKLRPGDTVIFPADDHGIRQIKIVPDKITPFIEWYWGNHNPEPFAGPVPKCGYMFEAEAAKWAPEQVDDHNWDPKPLLAGNLPAAPKFKSLQEKVQTGSYDVSAVTTRCTQCGLERDGHQRTVYFAGKNVRYTEAWCSQCERRTLHRTAVTEHMAVKLPGPKPRRLRDSAIALIKRVMRRPK